MKTQKKNFLLEQEVLNGFGINKILKLIITRSNDIQTCKNEKL